MGQFTSKDDKAKPRIVPEADHSDYYNRVLLNASTLQCPICFEVFAGTPLLLRCGHSFCQSCLKRLVTAEFNRVRGPRNISCMECPLCRRKTYFDENDENKSVAKNYTLEAILDDVHAIAIEQEPFVVLDETLRFENKRLNALLKDKENEINSLRKSLGAQASYTLMFQVLAAVLGLCIAKCLWFQKLP